jgi:hypothetical protein
MSKSGKVSVGGSPPAVLADVNVDPSLRVAVDVRQMA